MCVAPPGCFPNLIYQPNNQSLIAKRKKPSPYRPSRTFIVDESGAMVSASSRVACQGSTISGFSTYVYYYSHASGCDVRLFPRMVSLVLNERVFEVIPIRPNSSIANTISVIGFCIASGKFTRNLSRNSLICLVLTYLLCQKSLWLVSQLKRPCSIGNLRKINLPTFDMQFR